MRRMFAIAVLGAAGFFGFLVGVPTANAIYVVNFVQVGSDVVARGSGTIDLAGLLFLSAGSQSAAVWPLNAYEVTGPAVAAPADNYYGVKGPPVFGTSNFTKADTGSGDVVGIEGGSGLIFLPTGYVSGARPGAGGARLDGSPAPLRDTATYRNQTLSSLGLVPGGVYPYTFGSGAHEDSFTINIIGSSSVPEPASIVLFGSGLIALAALRRRR